MLIVVVLTVLCTVTQAATPPKWPTTYQVSGVLQLPYAEINEPFTAYYEAKKNRSRVDYYNSTVVTLQLGPVSAANKTDYGKNYKIAPAFLKGKQQTGCFLVNGTSESPAAIQSILPDLTFFQLAGQDSRGGETCDVWQNVTQMGDKKNLYKVWVSKADGRPVRYEMIGYDTLLGSHYDRYYLDYSDWKTNVTFHDDTFKPPKELKCGGFPGPGYQHSHVTVNPMLEYIHGHDDHVIGKFEQFKQSHNKQYQDAKEHSQRQHTFRNNLRYIDSKNRAGLSYTLSVNHLADRDSSELRQLRGFRRTVRDNGGLPFDLTQYNLRDLPEYADWRLYGAVTPVKDQAACGSCWSFGTVGTVEGAHFLKTGQLVKLSQQQLMDCSWDQGNNACDGGEDFRAYAWIMAYGLASSEDYGPYKGQDMKCRQSNITATAHMKGFVNVTSGDLVALKAAIATQGPVSVAIDASHKSLSFYSNGVYYEPSCGSGEDSLDHAVLAVGYGVLNGQAYWLVKNSWSTYWGNDGYVLMAQRENNCGVATAATYVIM